MEFDFRVEKRKHRDTSDEVESALPGCPVSTEAGPCKRWKATSTASNTNVASDSSPLVTSSLSLGVANNSTKEPLDVPVDIFYEILSYFNSVPFDVCLSEGTGTWSSEYFFTKSEALERHTALRTLSQISRSWRAFFLPLAWENVDLAVASPKGMVPWYTQTSTRLLQAEKTLVELPHVREFVRGIRVVLSKVSIDKTMPALVNCLRLCPNITTVSIHFAQSSTKRLFQDCFNGLRFPSVTSLVLPDHAHGLVKSFPNLTKVFCNRGDGAQVLKNLGPTGKRVEVLAGLCCGWKQWGPPSIEIQNLVKVTPNIRELRMSGFFRHGDPNLEKLKNLRRLEISETADQIPGGVLGGSWLPNSFGNSNAASKLTEKQLKMLGEVLSDCTVVVHRHNPWGNATKEKARVPFGVYHIPLKRA